MQNNTEQQHKKSTDYEKFPGQRNSTVWKVFPSIGPGACSCLQVSG